MLLETLRQNSQRVLQFAQFLSRKRDLSTDQIRMIRNWRADQAATIGKWLCLLGIVPILVINLLVMHIFTGDAQQMLTVALSVYAMSLSAFALVLHQKRVQSFEAIRVGFCLMALLAIVCLGFWLHLSLSQLIRDSASENVAGLIYAVGGFFLALSAFTVGMLMPILMFCHALVGILVWYLHEPATLLDWSVVIVCSDFFATAIFSLIHLQSLELALVTQMTRELTIQNDGLTLRKLERDLEFARLIHNSLTPPPRQQVIGNFQISTLKSKTQGLGGTWVATQKCGRDSMVIAVGDASGQGVQAAMIVQSLQTLWVSHLSRMQNGVLPFMSSLGQSFNRLGHQHKLTMSMGLVLIQGDQLTYYSAGHLPLVVRQGNEVRFVEAKGQRLGQESSPQFEPVVLPLERSSARGISVVMGAENSLIQLRDANHEQLLAWMDRIEFQCCDDKQGADDSDEQNLVLIRSVARLKIAA